MRDKDDNAIELVFNGYSPIINIRAEHPHVFVKLKWWAKLPFVNSRVKSKLLGMINVGRTIPEDRYSIIEA